MLPAYIIAWLRKKELEEYRALNSERYALRASINGSDNGYAPVSEAELIASREGSESSDEFESGRIAELDAYA